MSGEFESCIHDEDGIIAWRRGTGGNVELTYILVKDSKRDGSGRRLLVRMLKALRADPPYATVYGFTRTDNETAIKFYESMGFRLSFVVGVYDDGESIVFSQRYDTLCNDLGIRRMP